MRATELEWTVVRPGHLTDDPPTGRVRLEPGAEDGSVPRADVAAVVAALVTQPRTAGQVVGLVSGDDSVQDAVDALTRSS